MATKVFVNLRYQKSRAIEVVFYSNVTDLSPELKFGLKAKTR
jgi:hypothetical protein